MTKRLTAEPSWLSSVAHLLNKEFQYGYGIVVGRRLGGNLGAYDAAGAAAVVDAHLMPEEISESFLASVRPNASAPPPAVKGATLRSGRFGYSCAPAAHAASIAAVIVVIR